MTSCVSREVVLGGGITGSGGFNLKKKKKDTTYNLQHDTDNVF